MEKQKEKRKWTKYSEDELQFVKDNYGTMTPKEIAERLGRTYASVKTTARNLGFAAQMKRWTEEDDEYMRTHTWMLASDVARHLGRSYKALLVRASNLGISFGHGKGKGRQLYTDYTPDELDEIRRRALQPFTPSKTKEQILQEEQAARDESIDYYKRTRCGFTSNRQRREAAMREAYSMGEFAGKI